MAQSYYPPGGPGPSTSAWVPTSVPSNPTPQLFVPPPAAPSMAAPTGSLEGGFSETSPLFTGIAGNVLRHQGETYFQRGKQYVSQIGFLSGGIIHYLFDITPSYVQKKLLMLVAPYLRTWTFVRSPEHIAGGHRFLPPRQDANAPDLYIPLMALWTYCMLVGVGLLARGGFRPEAVYNAVSSALGSWICETLLLKTVIWVLGIGGAAPVLELGAYAGYSWVGACATLVATLSGSRVGYHIVWVYSSFASALFLVRTMKRVILQESRAYDPDSKTHNYFLLGLALLQFPLMAWLGRLPRVKAGARA